MQEIKLYSLHMDNVYGYMFKLILKCHETHWTFFQCKASSIPDVREPRAAWITVLVILCAHSHVISFERMFQHCEFFSIFGFPFFARRRISYFFLCSCLHVVSLIQPSVPIFHLLNQTDHIISMIRNNSIRASLITEYINS